MTRHQYSANTAIAIVVANMIGTGVFTSLGFQLMDIQSSFVLLMLWLVGGVTALCGALTYAELGSSMPRSGGEYNFLTQIYHPMAGFVSGWISATVGFAAPTALAAMTFGAYLEASIGDGISARILAALLVLLLTVVHIFSHAASGGFQTLFTLLKVLLILVFIVAVGWAVSEPQPVKLLPETGDGSLLMGSAFAVSLIYVNYAYTGWNAATYIINEVDRPQKSMPVILFIGTATVMILYLMLNYIFLYAAPMAEMEGNIEIGVIVARSAFGETGAMVMGIMLATLLVSTVSAMVLAGPRVLQVIGEDFRLFRVLAWKSRGQIPVVAILVQSSLTLFFVFSSTFESVLVFSGFVMGVNTFFAVAGVFILRRRGIVEGAYRTFGYPLTPLVYLCLMAWTLVFILINRPEEGWAGLGIILVGVILYLVSEKLNRVST